MNYLMYLIDYGSNLVYVIWASSMAYFDPHHTNAIIPLRCFIKI